MYHVVKTNVYIKNSSDNLINSFTIHEMWLSMYDTEGNKHHLCICDNLLNCWQLITSTWRKRKKYDSVLIPKCFFWKETSTYWKFKDNIFKLFRARTWHNCCATVLCKFLQLVISLLNEWSIDNSAAFICKTSVFG